MKSSIKTKLFFCILLSAMACSCAVGVFTYHNAKTLLIKDTFTILNEKADSASKQVKASIDTEFEKIKDFAKLPAVTSLDYTIEELAAHKDCVDKGAIFYPVYSTQPEKYENIAFYDKNGFAAQPGGNVIQVDRPYVSIPCGTGRDYVQDPFLSPVNNQVLMILSTVVRDSAGNAIGCMVDLLRGNVINTIAESVNIIENVHPIIINTKSKTILTAVSGDMDKNAVAEYSDFMMQTLGDGLSVFKDPIDGKKKVAIMKGIEGYDWAVICSAPYEAFFGSLVKLQTSIVFISILVGALAMLFGFIVLASVVRPLKSLQKSINEISSGNADLTKRIENSSSDEIGEIITGFNSFIEKLQNIVSQLKQQKTDLVSASTKLESATVDTSSSIKQMIGNIESARVQVENTFDSVEGTSTAVNQIASNISSLGNMVNNQSAGEQSASAAIEEMLGNINSVTHSMDLMANSFNSLYGIIVEGSNNQKLLNDKIIRVEEQSKALEEANKVIANIASQTNLLAMNAAIEAAHAGNAGQGFAVVADEIRKLSESSTTQSKSISDNLNSVVSTIGEASKTSELTSRTFVAVTELVQKVNNLVIEMKQAMTEQNEGSLMVNEALHSMKDNNNEVREASAQMNVGNKAILNQVQLLQNTATEIKSSMEEMTVDAQKINENGLKLSEVSTRLYDSINKIGEQIDLFKV